MKTFKFIVVILITMFEPVLGQAQGSFVSIPDFCTTKDLTIDKLELYKAVNITECDYSIFNEHSKLLKNLHHLDIMDYSLKDIPIGVFNIQSLISLRINNNRNLTTINQKIANLKNLEEIDLSGNGILILDKSLLLLPKLERLLIIINPLKKIDLAVADSNLTEIYIDEKNKKLIPSNLCTKKERRIYFNVSDINDNIDEYSKKNIDNIRKEFPNCKIEYYQSF